MRRGYGGCAVSRFSALVRGVGVEALNIAVLLNENNGQTGP